MFYNDLLKPWLYKSTLISFSMQNYRQHYENLFHQLSNFKLGHFRPSEPTSNTNPIPLSVSMRPCFTFQSLQPRWLSFPRSSHCVSKSKSDPSDKSFDDDITVQINQLYIPKKETIPKITTSESNETSVVWKRSSTDRERDKGSGKVKRVVLLATKGGLWKGKVEFTAERSM